MNKVETKKHLLPFQSQLAFAVVMFAVLVPGFSIRASDNEPSEAGVRETENAWSKAFMTGDTEYLAQLLDPAYVSVDPAGTPRSKDQIIRAAGDFAEKHPGVSVPPLSPTSTVSIKGDGLGVASRVKFPRE